MFPTSDPTTRMNGKAKQWKAEEAAFFASKLFGHKMIPVMDTTLCAQITPIEPISMK